MEPEPKPTPPEPARVDPRAALLEELWSDPEFRPTLQSQIKKKHPEAQIPEYDARTAVSAELDTFRKERDAEKAAREKAKQAEELEAARRQAIEAGIAPSEIPALEQFMRDNLIGDHGKAAQFYLAQQPAAPRSGPIQIPGTTDDAYYKGIFKDNEAWRKKRAYEFFDELATQRARRR